MTTIVLIYIFGVLKLNPTIANQNHEKNKFTY